VKRVIMLLSFVSIASIHAMENKKKLDLQKALQKSENKKHELKPQWEFLLYPEDAEIKLDKELEKKYQRIGNTFRIPKGMDSKLIHPTLIPERCDDFEIGHVVDTSY
jgi:hypothetical protein